MMTMEKIMSISKEDLQEASKILNQDDITQLIGCLSEKDDKIRYQALCLLQNRSQHSNDIYPFWNVFLSKLNCDNSYQRSIGLMLIAENTKWDIENKIDEAIDEYLIHLNDEKPITIRQCIQALSEIISYKNHLQHKIANALMAIKLEDIKVTMQKSILLDILNILLLIRKQQTYSELDNYIFQALSGEILDKKAKKQIESNL